MIRDTLIDITVFAVSVAIFDGVIYLVCCFIMDEWIVPSYGLRSVHVLVCILIGVIVGNIHNKRKENAQRQRTILEDDDE